jgi:hypothetical protein
MPHAQSPIPHVYPVCPVEPFDLLNRREIFTPWNASAYFTGVPVATISLRLSALNLPPFHYSNCDPMLYPLSPMPSLARSSLETKRLFVAKNEKAAWDQIPAAFRFSEISLATNQPQTSADFKSIREVR